MDNEVKKPHFQIHRPNRFNHDATVLEPPGTEDDMFREEAKRMKKECKESVSKKLTKYYCADMIYKGRRHMVYLKKTSIRYRRPEQLAGLLKKKCLEG